MSSWAIRIPYRNRGDSIAEAGIASGEAITHPKEREVVVNVIGGLMATPGIATVGDALDRIDRASLAERRALLDRARVAAGLDTCADADADRVFRLANSAPKPPTDAAGNTFQSCAAEGCGVVPTDPSTGIPIAVPARKWWCPRHRHLAGPDDGKPRERP
jgi:hypothetical protein